MHIFASASNFTKSITPLWVFFTFFEIVQMIPNRAKCHIYMFGSTSPPKKSGIKKDLIFSFLLKVTQFISFSQECNCVFSLPILD